MKQLTMSCGVHVHKVLAVSPELEAIDLRFWKKLNPGQAFDVVGASEVPQPSEILGVLRLQEDTDMESLGVALGFIDRKSAHAASVIFLRQGMWVGYDEAGLELCRDSSYWKVRTRVLSYAEVLDVPMDRMPAAGETWKHHNGAEYEVLLLTNQYSERPEYPVNVVYQGANGKTWSKTLANFLKKMTFVKGPEEVACEPLEVPALDKRDSLSFEKLLAEYHAEVWEAASSDGATVHDEDGCQDYDLAGVDKAKQLIAMYRGEATYTHPSELYYPGCAELPTEGSTLLGRGEKVLVDQNDLEGDHMYHRFVHPSE